MNMIKIYVMDGNLIQFALLELLTVFLNVAELF